MKLILKAVEKSLNTAKVGSRTLCFATCFLLLLSDAVSAQKRQTDREFDGLKGAVKAVVTERYDFKNPSKKTGVVNRRRESEIVYAPDGSRLTWKTYDYRAGTLFESVRYALIDGEKVSIEEDGNYPNKLVEKAVKTENKAKTPPDPRYTFKFKYKYDAKGNITEEAWYQNDGALWIRYVYKSQGDKTEELVYDKNGKLNQKVIHIYDAKRNEIETVFYDVKTDKPDGSEFIEYLEFDAIGNWTKRVVSESDGKSRSFIQSRETIFRTLTYF